MKTHKEIREGVFDFQNLSTFCWTRVWKQQPKSLETISERLTELWLNDCFIQDMSSLRLFFRENTPDPAFDRSQALPGGCNVERPRALAGPENLLGRFNPQLVGFGIVGPSPDVTTIKQPAGTMYDGRRVETQRFRGTKMNALSLSFVPLQQANLCLDCEMVTAAHTNCPACGSVALLSISRALARPGYAGLRHATNTAVTTMSAKCAHQGDFLHST